jgi:hypothetical protein
MYIVDADPGDEDPLGNAAPLDLLTSVYGWLDFGFQIPAWLQLILNNWRITEKNEQGIRACH